MQRQLKTVPKVLWLAGEYVLFFGGRERGEKLILVTFFDLGEVLAAQHE